MTTVVVAASGFFDPLHSGHIFYLKKAKELGDKLVVIVNSDQQAVLKKGFVLMPLDQRIAIIRELPFVDAVIVAADEDGTVCRTLELIRPHIFAKGGDRTKDEIPENKTCDQLKIQIIDGLGGKVYSSRTVVKELISNIEQIPKEYLEGK